MRRIDWAEQAVHDFEAALAYIAEEDPHNARLVRDRVLNTLRYLESYTLGLPAPKGSYKLYIPKTSYFVIFRRSIEGDITLQAFLHTSQDWGKFDWEKLV